MMLEVSDSLPATVVALLRQEDALTEAIRTEYNRIVHEFPTYEESPEKKELRDNITRMKEERDIIGAKLSGWWRGTLTQNGIDWETADDATH